MLRGKNIFRYIRNLERHTNSKANIIDTYREDRRLEDMNLVLMYNGIKSMFDYYVSKVVIGKR